MNRKKAIISSNFSSHIIVSAPKTCKKENICFVLLPPNSSQLTQLLDFAYFCPMKIVWWKILLRFESCKGSRSTDLSKSDFLKLLKELLDALDEDNGSVDKISGFWKAGLSCLTQEGTKPATKLYNYNITCCFKQDSSWVFERASEGQQHLQTTRKQPLKSGILIIPCKCNKRSHTEAASPPLPSMWAPAIFLCTCCPLLEQPLQCHHPVQNHKCIWERSWSGLGQCRVWTNLGCQTIVMSHHQWDVSKEAHHHLILLDMWF